jgi:ferric-dicitrate binding protein FerR (iron transport regulator)
MDHRDWEAWDAQEPPRGFAERVVEAARRAPPPRDAPAGAPESADPHARPRSRASRVFAGLLLAAALAAVIVFGLVRQRADSRGAIVASDRREVRVAGRAIAVLERGARVTWDGDAIEQTGGDVFWRVEPGARFVVHTPAADVTVKGTCFRVKVRGGDEEMNARDVKSGAVGAAIAATALVGVYEGKVAVSHAGQSVDLVAGQQAEAGPSGVRRVGGPDDPAQAAAKASGSESESEQALTQANANLADTVRDYRRKLEAIEAQKKKLEKQLAEAQAQLSDGGPSKSEFDLSQEDWKELAKNGEVRMRVPCLGSKGDFSQTPTTLNKLGLAPQDGPLIQAAYQKSYQRTWGVIEPLCSKALGGADVSKIGQQACASILMDQAKAQDTARYNEDVREVAEILAGTRQAPAPGQPVDPILQAYLTLAREPQNIQSDLAQSIGPDDAKRLIFSEQGCWWNSSHGVGPRDGE